MEWTFEENKMFENALAEVDHGSPSFYEDVAHRIPWRSVDEIKEHYNALVEDIKMIESDCYPIPIYENGDEEYQGDFEFPEENGSSSKDKQTSQNNQRRKTVHWTEEEHQMFLMGLSQYGRGNWKIISRHCVITKTPSQVASHAQKFFKRQSDSNTRTKNKRRFSINDINTVDPTLIIPQMEITISSPNDLPPNLKDNKFSLPDYQNPTVSHEGCTSQSGLDNIDGYFDVGPSASNHP